MDLLTIQRKYQLVIFIIQATLCKSYNKEFSKRNINIINKQSPLSFHNSFEKTPKISQSLTNIWIDTDSSNGDCIAIFTAIYHNNIKLNGITVTQGKTTLEKAYRNIRVLISLLDRPDINIYKGANTQQQSNTYFNENRLKNYSGKLDFPDSLLTQYKKTQKSDPEQDFKNAEGNIVDTYHAITKLEHIVTYVILGPSTTFATMIKTFPDILKKIEKVIIVGGILNSDINSHNLDFNARNDPESLFIILNNKLETIIVPYDEQSNISLDNNNLEKIRSLNLYMGDIIFQLFYKGSQRNEENHSIIMESSYGDGVMPIFIYDNYCKKLVQTNNWDIILDGKLRGKVLFNVESYNQENPKNDKLHTNLSNKSKIWICKNIEKTFNIDMIFKILDETKAVHSGNYGYSIDIFLKQFAIFWLFMVFLCIVVYQVFYKLRDAKIITHKNMFPDMQYQDAHNEDGNQETQRSFYIEKQQQIIKVRGFEEAKIGKDTSFD